MKILEDILSTIDLATDIKDIRLGIFHIAVVTRNCGLAATLIQDTFKQYFRI